MCICIYTHYWTFYSIMHCSYVVDSLFHFFFFAFLSFFLYFFFFSTCALVCRDAFYSALREWEKERGGPNWNMEDALAKRVQ